jgi:hypothetical protein
MILNSDALFESCLIKTNGGVKKHNIEESLTEKEDDMKIKMQMIKPPSSSEEVKLENLETPIEELEELSNQILKSENLDAVEETETRDDASVEYDLESEGEDGDEDEDEKLHHPPLTFGNEIKPTAIVVNTNKPSVKFQNFEKEQDMNGLEEIDFDINSMVEDKDKDKEKEKEEEDANELMEIDFASNLDISPDNKMTLKKPNQVYYEIYKQARNKAKQAKKDAIMAFLEAKNIKKTYMLEDLDESDSDNSDLDNVEEFAE